jgi:metal-responsive CopG/Arc/MetJ family transcriptional regulator
LTIGNNCQTMSYMKTQKITVRIETDIEESLDELVRTSHESRSSAVRQLLREAIEYRKLDWEISDKRKEFLG